MELLRFITCGSVTTQEHAHRPVALRQQDLLRDQVAALERSSAKGGNGLNLALLTDGLRAEREQGITIDVAYKYFATPDASSSCGHAGHVQYTRNMVTAPRRLTCGAAVDARQGVLEQTRRHAYLAVCCDPHVVLAVNKMTRSTGRAMCTGASVTSFWRLPRIRFADVHAIRSAP